MNPQDDGVTRLTLWWVLAVLSVWLLFVKDARALPPLNAEWAGRDNPKRCARQGPGEATFTRPHRLP